MERPDDARLVDAVAESMTRNIDSKVASGFGDEWSAFPQSEDRLTPAERKTLFETYFRIFPWERLPADAVGLDAGCGSGRWSAEVARRVKHLHVLDASAEALGVARRNLAEFRNVTFHLASIDEIPLPSRSLDFAFSLGVLHHVPDTLAALKSIADKLKAGGPFLVYLYYAFDNRPSWYRVLWAPSNVLRAAISRLPHALRYAISQMIAALVYWPLARLSALLERTSIPVRNFPLSYYRDKSFYVMRTDAYDRFCTRLEKRFTRQEIEDMLIRSGFRDVAFSDSEPYWCAVAYKAKTPA